MFDGDVGGDGDGVVFAVAGWQAGDGVQAGCGGGEGNGRGVAGEGGDELVAAVPVGEPAAADVPITSGVKSYPFAGMTRLSRSSG